MSDAWLHLPIYLDGRKRFDASSVDPLTVEAAYERMAFVFDAIECCYAEGRLLDVETFDRLEELGDRIRQNDIPALAEVFELAGLIGRRYGLDVTEHSDSSWVRRTDSGEYRIWIDQRKIVAENDEPLIGRERSGGEHGG
jgi:hypothetical protein